MGMMVLEIEVEVSLGLMAAVFGDRGLHARSVFGAMTVRANLPIVIDSIFEVVDGHA